MIYLTKRFTFAASHVLRNPSFSNEQNLETYGKCSWDNGHGHNYTLEVTVKGEVPEATGMIIDLKELKSTVNKKLVDKLDHKHLNYDVDFLRGVIPTAENIALKVWDELQKFLPEDMLYEIKLWETENNWVVYRGQ
ncbi:MAG TPA: 6-carboxytetrahydropterin synthase [Candidatus Marinimicrobia bacterium]|nr:6-carboxytetrahydropterin synthase [Candidatus Neomarinimicrobiota bacterium]